MTTSCVVADGAVYARGFSTSFRHAFMTLILGGILTSCTEDMPQIRLQLGQGDPTPAPRFVGIVAGGEPQAVLVARELLLNRGNAADAAAALGLALTVTLPSRAGIAGGGVCLVRAAKTNTAEVLEFFPTPGAGEARVTARGLFDLHARYGKAPWPQVAAPAEQLARFGSMVPRALARDLEAYGSVLIADHDTFNLFTTSARAFVTTGDNLKQLELAAVLSDLRLHGPGDLAVENGERAPQWLLARKFKMNDVDVLTLPESKTESVADAAVVGTSFTIADAEGMVVNCTLSMGRPFGRGTAIPGTGYLRAEGIDVTAFDAVIVTNADTGETRAAAAGRPAAVNQFAEAITKSRRRLDLAPIFAGPVENVPMNGWACASGLQIDGRACEAFTQTDSAGYALVLVPSDS